MPANLPAAVKGHFDRVFGADTDDPDPRDAYEPGTVLDPEDEEVLELLREIGEYERRGRP
jgi:hypothetical protein